MARPAARAKKPDNRPVSSLPKPVTARTSALPKPVTARTKPVPEESVQILLPSREKVSAKPTDEGPRRR